MIMMIIVEYVMNILPSTSDFESGVIEEENSTPISHSIFHKVTE